MALTAPRDWSAISGGIVTAASLNTDLRDNLAVLSTHTHTGAAGFGATSMSGLTLAALVTLTFADQSANPDAAGELQRNGNDLLWYGSSVVNLSAADASAGTASLRTLGTTSVKAAAGNHTHVIDMSDLTPTTTESSYVAGDATNITIGYSVASGASRNVDQAVTLSTPGVIFAFATWCFQGVSGNQTFSAGLTIDGTSQVSYTGTATHTDCLTRTGSGSKQLGAGSYTINFSQANTNTGSTGNALLTLMSYGWSTITVVLA